MKRTFLSVLFALVLICPAAMAQMAHPCYDMNGDGSSNISDLIYTSEVLVGHVALPTGQGDIDGRAGFNLGDLRYYAGWLFLGYSEGSCPPHPSYTIAPGIDTLFLASATIPAGSGQVSLPIVLKAINQVDDILLPFHLTTTSGTVNVHDINREESQTFLLFNANWTGDDGIIQFSSIVQEFASPGAYLLGSIIVDYSGSTGGTVTAEATTLSEPYQFPHYVYGEYIDAGYAGATIASPAIVSGGVPGFPTMSSAPDTLHFETLVGYPDPDPQSFSVSSDSGPFSWTATGSPAWVQLSAASGVSGQSVEVTPNISALGVGIHHGTVTIVSSEALGSPDVIDVMVHIKPQYPTFDANCDGNFSIGDIVLQINYIFGGGQLPCDPCTGEPLKK